MVNIENLFKGIAVIIDNEIKKNDSTIYEIKEVIESKNIPVVTYEDIPDVSVIQSFSNAAFIILDWDYFNEILVDGEKEERIMVPTELKNEKEQQLIYFIKEIINNIFVPVFIFTAISSDDIKNKLRDSHLWKDGKPNRIFVKQKAEVSSEEDLFTAIRGWLREVPSAYVLKEWEKTIISAKNKMFLEMYNYSSNWVKIMWDMLKQDSIENHHEFGEFVTRNLVNRINKYKFEEEFLESGDHISSEELLKVLEGERYITYEAQPEQVYTGDLFKKSGNYYLNIRAQCDLARFVGGEYDPILYCLKGKKLKDKDIVVDDIKLTTEGELVIGANKRYSLKELGEICKKEEDIIELNSLFRKQRNTLFFSKGEILEKKPEVIITCVNGEKAIKFDLNLKPTCYSELKEYRIGRILPPYITRVQQKCSQFIVREGVMPIPSELFSNIEV